MKPNGLPRGIMEGKERMMQEANEIRDLCSTCNFASECLQRATLIRPVLFCEEFDCFVPVFKKPVKETERYPAIPTADGSDHQGLCFDCMDRESCVYTTAGRKTLYCEEYH